MLDRAHPSSITCDRCAFGHEVSVWLEGGVVMHRATRVPGVCGGKAVSLECPNCLGVVKKLVQGRRSAASRSPR